MAAAGMGFEPEVGEPRAVVELVAEREPEAAIADDVQATAQRECPVEVLLVALHVVRVGGACERDAEAHSELRIGAEPRCDPLAAERQERALERADRGRAPG